jgi:hypothetical protein
MAEYYRVIQVNMKIEDTISFSSFSGPLGRPSVF